MPTELLLSDEVVGESSWLDEGGDIFYNVIEEDKFEGIRRH